MSDDTWALPADRREEIVREYRENYPGAPITEDGKPVLPMRGSVSLSQRLTHTNPPGKPAKPSPARGLSKESHL